MKLKLSIIYLLVLGSCSKDTTEQPKEELQGGKGGIYNIAIFPEFNSKGYSGKVYIKYGSKEQPTDDLYSDSSSTMTEPGFTHHA
ncbi:MAG: hypothetical protein IT245_06440, partial [Bacteroidia bacterium]|nr:hypothetical protein [Bacteroidia bacterium]